MPTDCELLHQYASKGGEVAFAELVRRHADLVYSVALRVTCNSGLAQDVTQTVFTQLAQQARGLGHYHTLVGWLHTAARRRAIDVVRSEQRRRIREQEATAMQNINSAPETNWAEISPLLDEAVGQLKETDREAVLLRFFKNFSHQEVGAVLGLGEDAARKRVERALEKLREHFASRGVTASSALLTAAIAENSVQAAPVGLVAGVTTAALAGVGGVTISSAWLLSLFTFIMSTKTKTILAAVVVLAITATVAVELHNAAEQPSSVSASSTSAAPVSVAASSPKAAPVAAVVAKPTVAPVPASSSSGSTAGVLTFNGTMTMSSPPPNADLKTAIPALIHYLETDDFEHILPFLMTPDELQQQLQGGQTLVELADKFRTELKNHGGQDFLAQALTQIQGQPVSLDPTGTQAIYELDPPVQGHKNILFIKKDGLWYGPQ